MEEEAEDRGEAGPLALRAVVEVEDADVSAWPQGRADAGEERPRLLRREVVDDVEAERPVVLAAVVDLVHIADEAADAVAHPGLGDDLLPHPGAPRQVDDRRLQPGVAAAERHRELAVGAGDVKQRVGAFDQWDRLRDFVAGEARHLELAANVGLPVGVLWRFLVQLDVLAVADQVFEPGVPVPVMVGVGEEVAEVGLRAGIEPGAAALGHLVAAVRVLLDVAEGGDDVEDADRPLRLQPQVLGQLGGIARPHRQRAEHSGPLRHLQRARHRHRVHRLADRRRHLAEQQSEPLDQAVGDRS
jgi:hypothetical protein